MRYQAKQGAILAVLAYTMWGLAPVYFKLLETVSSIEILGHRIVWSVVVLAVIITINQTWRKTFRLLTSKRTVIMLVISSLFLAFNWWLFIWAINNDRILDASLGYYINPILNVALGVLFLGERLNKMQSLAVVLAITGVLIQVITFGSFPVIAFSLATSFAIYGLIRKTVKIDAVTGIFWESALLLIPALLFWSLSPATASSNMFNNDIWLNLLFVAAGIVTTAPLLCFVGAARRLNYSTLGFFQYIGPSIMFMFALFVYNEQLDAAKWQTFGFIWSALIIYSYGSLQKAKKFKQTD